jgi:tryptophan synthase beta subunit
VRRRQKQRDRPVSWFLADRGVALYGVEAAAAAPRSASTPATLKPRQAGRSARNAHDAALRRERPDLRKRTPSAGLDYPRSGRSTRYYSRSGASSM